MRHPEKCGIQRLAMKSRTDRRRGVTLTELLCVIAIIAVLAAVYLPAVLHAFVKVRKFLTGK
jgi:prepilin-type N-terminal cleavage/methylation domain-containing protein